MSLEPRPPGAAWVGTIAALAIMGAWVVHLAWLLNQPTVFVWWAPASVLVQTFLHTGLFIVAHDGMHGSIAPGHERTNKVIGQSCLLMYALFPMAPLLRAHIVHHRSPGTADDPDHTGGRPLGYFRWYLRFMLQYLRWYQLLGMAMLFNAAHYLGGIANPNLVVFWVVPSLLSTFQLFTFGTYIPHRVPPGGHRDLHAARSSSWPHWLSLLTCYHFGYHWEHHQYPAVPWWRLPTFHRMTRNAEG